VWQSASTVRTYFYLNKKRGGGGGLSVEAQTLLTKQFMYTICQNMQQHITKMAFKERRVPPIARISAISHKERATHDITSPFTFKEDNKDWHNNLTSSFGLWNCYKWSQMERTRKTAVRGPIYTVLKHSLFKIINSVLPSLQHIFASGKRFLYNWTCSSPQHTNTTQLLPFQGKRMKTPTYTSLLQQALLLVSF
jgi:hypothetical protein